MPPQQPQPPYGGDPQSPYQPQGPNPPYPPQPGPGGPGQAAPPYPQPGSIPAPAAYTPPPGGAASAGPDMPRYTPHHTGQPSGAVIPPPPPRPKSPYDFFLNPQSRQKNSNFRTPFQNASKGAQLAMIAGGGLFVVIVLGIATLFLPDNEPKPALVAVAQAETETLRICSEGVDQAKVAANRNFAVNCTLSITSEQRQLLTQLGKAGIKLSDKTLSQGRNAKADRQLTAAKNASDYDDIFKAVSQDQLTTQARLIKQAGLAEYTTDAERAVLAKHAESTKLLQQQLTQR